MEPGERLKELIAKNVLTTKDQQLKLHGSISYSLYPANSMAYTLQKVGEKVGGESLYRMGADAMSAALEEIRRDRVIFDLLSSKPEENAATVMQLLGFGIMSPLSVDKNARIVSGELNSHLVLVPARQMYGDGAHALDFYRGAFSAFVEQWFGLQGISLAVSRTQNDQVFLEARP